MRFKSLLFESNNSIEDLQKLLSGGDWIFKKPFLFRGSNTEIESYSIRGAREDRTPKDTAQNVANFVSCYNDVFLSEFPNRSRSTFTTRMKKEAEWYGDNVFLVIPHKSAKVGHSSFDAYHEFFDHIEVHINSIRRSVPDILSKIDKNSPKKFRKFFDLVKVIKKGAVGECVEMKEYYQKYNERVVYSAKYLKELKSELVNSDLPTGKNFENLYDSLISLSRVLNMYFDSLKLGYPDDEDWYETVVEGKYIYLSYEFYEKNSEILNRELQ